MSKFGDAFSKARKAGKKTFMFNGKSYTTKTKEEAAAPIPAKRSMKRKLKIPQGPQKPRKEGRDVTGNYTISPDGAAMKKSSTNRRTQLKGK